MMEMMMSDIHKKFKDKWPTLYSDVQCGFSLPEGWEKLLWKLSEDLYPLVKDDPSFAVAQVKEKFGGLRFYFHMDGRNEKVDDLVSEAEAKSFETCQSCSSPSGTREGSVGYICTLCVACRESGEKGWGRRG